ncbi:esterase-like activity of phytase family protein [Paracidovorax sp. MALMAid1276]|uniref:esterase-like activity of phytase family protein n=1 Tax=Paracidovorax sp. MALMAid1276 TaxID=3411631 RepID=UPI003B9C93BF
MRLPTLSRYHLPFAAALLACAALLPACTAPAAQPALPAAPPACSAPPCLRLIGHATLEHRWLYGGTTVGGLSGIDYDPGSGQYLLLSDDRSALDPARYYTARIRYTAHALATPEFTGVFSLRHAVGQPYAPARRAVEGVDVPDPEAVRWLPGGTTFLWTSEGDFARGFGPALRATRAADGALLRDYALPDAFAPRPAARTGPRDNATLEGLALSPDGRTAWLAMEGPWLQDGPRATPASGGAPLRITAIDVDSGRALRQIAYPPDPVPHKSPMPGGYTTNGVSEILADGDEHLLVLERAYTLGVGNSVRLYRIALDSGSDTLGLAALTPGNHTPAAKTLVADFTQLGLPHVDNIEGMTWGPRLPAADGGGRVLVLVSDDNFNPAQTTQFIAVEYRVR